MRKLNSLTPATRKVVMSKGTEAPHSGKYCQVLEKGTYLCRACGIALFRADSQFSSGCGWPSFDATISKNVARSVDADGFRTEITCSNCKAHLGHVFEGEFLTDKNTRHCVNSVALDFVADEIVQRSEEAIFAAGCFWGVQYLFDKLNSVLLTEVGYIGGMVDEPTYNQICSKQTGHYEAMRVIFDPEKISYDAIVKYFFEIHDPTQPNGQGPDIGSQYLSAIFCFDNEQKMVTNTNKDLLISKGLSVCTEIKEMSVFWPAEEYHQSYYQKHSKQPYCHVHTRKF